MAERFELGGKPRGGVSARAASSSQSAAAACGCVMPPSLHEAVAGRDCIRGSDSKITHEDVHKFYMRREPSLFESSPRTVKESDVLCLAAAELSR